MISFDIASGDVLDDCFANTKHKNRAKEDDELKYKEYLRYKECLELEIVPVEDKK